MSELTDDHKRCSICGFIVDTSFKATKPTVGFTMAGRTKKQKGSIDMSTITIDFEQKVITVYGVRYALEIFEHLGLGPIGSWVRIVKREDGVVTCERKPGGEDLPEEEPRRWPGGGDIPSRGIHGDGLPADDT